MLTERIEYKLDRLLENTGFNPLQSKYYYYATSRPKMKYGDPQKKEDGRVKMRYLNPSYGELKLIQEYINYWLQKAIYPPSYAYGAVRHRNNVLNAVRHRHNKFFLSLDLKDFFKRVTSEQVFIALIELGFSEKAATDLTCLTTYKNALPQGAPTSPIVANIVLHKLGDHLSRIARKNDLTFTTFIDDLQFSSRRNFKHFIPGFIKLVIDYGFHPNFKKITYSSKNPEVTGIFINKKGLLYLKEEMLRKAKDNKQIMAYVRKVEQANRCLYRENMFGGRPLSEPYRQQN